MEIKEVQARSAQMEKSMKWWSDCTQTWRNKWTDVRNERNKAREELKLARSQLDDSTKEKLEMEVQIVQLKKEIEKVHLLMLKHTNLISHKNQELKRETTPDLSDGLKTENNEDGLVTTTAAERDGDIASTTVGDNKLLSKDDQAELLQQQVAILQLRLEEAQKTIHIEREEKNSLHKNLEKFRHEFADIREKCEEMRSAKQEAVRELLTLQEQHRAELRITTNTLHEEVTARECLEKRLFDLRTDLEKLQSENAVEWGKRERLESEKLNMERENKKLRTELQDLQDRLERKGCPVTTSDVEIRNLQQELADKTKEIVDLKHSNGKIKKMLAEAKCEMGHVVRRAEQYEGEVKRLRTRVEELKRELATVEDELDATCNHVRRLQRTNEELIGQNEGMRVEYAQLQHLQTR